MLSLACRRLERNLFNCSCDIRWIQLWQEKGEANLQNQNLSCMNMDAAIIRLRDMNITQCGKGSCGWAQGRLGGSPVLSGTSGSTVCLGNLMQQNSVM